MLPLAWAWGCHWRLQTLRCPNCGNPIYRRTVRLFGATWTYRSIFPRRHCSRCGFDLSAPVTMSPVSDGKRREERTSGVRVSFTRALSVRQLVVILLGGIVVNVLTNVWIIVFGVRPGDADFVMWGRLAGSARRGESSCGSPRCVVAIALDASDGVCSRITVGAVIKTCERRQSSERRRARMSRGAKHHSSQTHTAGSWSNPINSAPP